MTVVGHSGLGSVREVTVWVTSMETGAPVKDAEVFLFGEIHEVRSSDTECSLDLCFAG